ncbi:hypothetical protein FDX19_13595 [Citrobacter sp. wls619]|uniref:hypothetical protein n=1 Tax=Citrobacter sp. wls619 TaxID=2576432 RepID=UPI0010C9E075|nr:hypothetical protein [Citrobacter sp. wls619]TKV08983.1 hypothetical protein FDX19_13595 [Citrobacter sp. wls619]
MSGRTLTSGEITLAKQLYKDSIDYDKVKIHNESYLPFDMQRDNVAMTPNGEMYYMKNTYEPDFSLAGINQQHLFMHEMMHVWQHQKEYMVRTRGLFSGVVSYYYDLDGSLLKSYPMEQQACIVSDYWLLSNYTINDWINYRNYKGKFSLSDIEGLKQKYVKILGKFPYSD